LILVDTSVWVDHFRAADARLAVLASHVEIIQHRFVTGELAMGNLTDWRRTIDTLDRLPAAEVVAPSFLLDFVEERALAGTGIGFVDAHLLACAATSGHALWTRDKRLVAQASRIGTSLFGD
jgi:predicted nucleic acid-binding protein